MWKLSSLLTEKLVYVYLVLYSSIYDKTNIKL